MKLNKELLEESDFIISASKKLFGWNYLAFPFLTVVCVAFSVLEGVTYQGFIDKYFFIDIKIILAALLLSGIFVLLHLKPAESKPSEYYVFLKNLMVISFIIMLFVSCLLYIRLPLNRNSILVGSSNFIYPNRFLIATVLSGYFLVIYNLCFGKFSHYLKKQLKTFSAQELTYAIFVIGIILWTFVINAGKDILIFKGNILPILSNPTASYDEKLRSQVGPIFDYYKFVVAHTPPDALILNPLQQGQWPDVSNQGFTRYFIYPRNLISEDVFDKTKDSPDFAFMIGERKLHDNSPHNRWPDFPIPAKRVIYYPNNKDIAPIEVLGDYNPKKVPYADYWGIIEIDTKRW